MIFSELSFIQDETGLKYDEELGILSGVKNGVPIVVFDNKSKHRFDIVCGAVVSERDLSRIYTMTQSFPKKTVQGIENADGCIRVYCKDYNLMQERLPLLISFLEKLTHYASQNMRGTTPIELARVLELSDYMILTKRRADVSKGNLKKGKPQFDVKSTLKGVLGGLIGVIIGGGIFVAFIMMSDMVAWLGAIVMSAAVISLYTVFSHKLKTVDAIITAVLTFAGWLLANGFAYLFQIYLKNSEAGGKENLFGILSDMSNFIYAYPELAGDLLNRLIVTFIFVVAGAVGSYYFYYKHHANDMY